MARFLDRLRGRPTPRESEPESAATPASDAPQGGSRKRELKPDPDRIGIAGSVPFVRLPDPARLFTERAERLRVLAPGHVMEGYLSFLAAIATAQAAVLASGADALRPRPLSSEASQRSEHGMPPLSVELLGDDPAFATGFERLLQAIDLDTAPDPARAARDALRAAGPEGRLDLAAQIFQGAYPYERLGECVFAAAALQIYLAGQAARLDAKALKPVADGVCPACGGGAVSSLIVSWTPADKARYCACSLCGTLWNQVRIRCTACGSGEGISYYSLDEISKDVQVETCTACNSYIKHLHQDRAPGLDPIADDVASYGLDLKIAEEGFRRAGLNPLFLT